MALTAEKLDELIFGTERFRRFTQDSPVMPDVWIAFGLDPKARLDLLLTPHVQASAPELATELRRRLGGHDTRAERQDEARVAYNESYVVAELDFHELVEVALPLTHWWRAHVWPTKADLNKTEQLREPAVKKRMAQQLAAPGPSGFGGEISPDLLWLIRIVGGSSSSGAAGGRAPSRRTSRSSKRCSSSSRAATSWMRRPSRCCGVSTVTGRRRRPSPARSSRSRPTLLFASST